MTPREGVCQHGWRGQPPERGERIVTPCPACGSQSLFIGTGGHLTCSVVPSGLSSGCPNPSVEDAINALRDAARCHAATPHPAATAREEAWKALLAYAECEQSFEAPTTEAMCATLARHGWVEGTPPIRFVMDLRAKALALARSVKGTEA